MKPTKFGVGQAVKRVEDVRLVSGRGNYASDAVEGVELSAVFLRSPHGHAKFRIEDIEAARAAPGVRAVFVASDFADLGALPCVAPVSNSDGSNTPLKPYPVMAANEVHHVGDIVAMAVADTTSQARDADGIDPGRVGRASGRRRHGKSRPARSAAGLCRRARQCGLRCSYRRQAKNGRHIRGGDAHGPYQNRKSAGGRQLHGAAFGGRRIRSEKRQIYAEHRNSRRARHQGRDRGPDLEDPAGVASRDHPGRRRRFWHQGSRLSGISAGSRGGQATGTPASAGRAIAASISSATRRAATT